MPRRTMAWRTDAMLSARMAGKVMVLRESHPGGLSAGVGLSTHRGDSSECEKQNCSGESVGGAIHSVSWTVSKKMISGCKDSGGADTKAEYYEHGRRENDRMAPGLGWGGARGRAGGDGGGGGEDGGVVADERRIRGDRQPLPAPGRTAGGGVDRGGGGRPVLVAVPVARLGF